jgi:hypothetical protein
MALALTTLVGAAQLARAQGFFGKIDDVVAPQREQSTPSSAEMTPQAIVANAPSLPTPKEWAANDGHTEVFKAKIAELKSKKVATLPNVTRTDLKRAQASQKRQRRQAEADAARQEQTLRDGTDLIAMLNLSQADMDKVSKMSRQEAEAFMMRRMREKGISMDKLTPYSAADERRDRAAEAEGEATRKADEAQAAYMRQAEVTNNKIDEARRNATARVAAIPKPEFGELIGPEAVMQGLATAEQLASQERRVQSIRNDYRAAAYQVWHEFIVTAQGHLKFLLPYAQAADDALAGTPGAGTNSAAIVATQYLNITASEPEINV